MSKLQDNDMVPCYGCGYLMDEKRVTYCRKVSNGIHMGIKYKRRCSMVVCTCCEYCDGCNRDIEQYKRRIRTSRNNSPAEFEREKEQLLEYHGVKYNI